MSKQKKYPQKLGENQTLAGAGKRGRKGKGMCFEDRPLLEPNAAGIDIGAREIYVAVPPDRDEHPVRVFSTFTEDLEKMAQWLVSCGITTVAMESTGVYWIPPYDGAGTPPCQALPGGRPRYEECTGTAHGLARMPVVAVSAFGRTAASGLSTGWGSLRGAVIDAAPQ
jgi:hypothetical protein